RWIAEQVAALGLGDGGVPVAGRGDCQHGEGGYGQGADKAVHFVSSSCDPRLRANDSSTVRSSGSPISRRLSPNSIGIGLRDGGAFARLSAWGGLTSPCRSLTRAT